MRVGFPRRYSLKPPPSAQLDWSHPLTYKLQAYVPMTEGNGYPREIVTNTQFTTGTLGWDQKSFYGIGQRTENVSAKILNTGVVDSRLTGLAGFPITLCAYGHLFGNNSNFRSAWGLFDSGTTSLAQWGIAVAATNKWQLLGPSGGTTTSTQLSPSGPFFTCISWDGTTITFFTSGTTGPTISTVANNTAVTAVGSKLYVTGSNSGLLAWYGSVSGALMWNRVLTIAEMFRLYSNPWQIFMPVPNVRLGGVSIVPMLDRHFRQQEPNVLVRM